MFYIRTLVIISAIFILPFRLMYAILILLFNWSNDIIDKFEDRF